MKRYYTSSMLWIVFFFLPVFTMANITSPDTDSLSERLTKLEKEIKQIKEEKAVASKPAPSAVQVGGQAFLFYSYTTKGIDGDDFNKFDMDRMYINVKADLLPDAKFSFSSDLYRNTSAGTYYSGLSMRIKLAYIDYMPASNVSLKMGIIPNVYSGYIDSYTKYRILGANVTDKNGLFSSADLGFSASYYLPDKIGEISAFIVNGNSYTSPELNRYKDLAARITLNPFTGIEELKGLALCGFYYKGSNLSTLGTAAKKDRYGAFLNYNYSILNITGEYIIKKEAADLSKIDNFTNGSCISFSGDIKVPVESLKRKLSLLWRYDIYDPNTDVDNNSQKLLIAGIAYKLNDKVTFILDYQGLTTDSKVLTKIDKTLTDSDTKLFLHSLVNF